MPVINMPVAALLRQVNRGGSAVLDEARLPQVLHDVGVELDEITTTIQHQCRTCGCPHDRTEAQGAPTACGNCGTDFRANPALLQIVGRNTVARLDMLAVRPDIFDVGGMGRYIRGFLGAQTGLAQYEASAPTLAVHVDAALARDESRRPFIACAVLRNVTLDDERVKFLMNLQEDLHWALGRDRKLASIGVYDLDALRGDAFQYRAVAPGALRFTPLGMPDAQLTPADILEQHATGRAYAHLLRGMSAYPLLQDAAGTVLSMPPIINSHETRVTGASRNLFVDVTGLSQRTVDRALNILVTSSLEVIAGATLERVTIITEGSRRQTPELTPARMALSLPLACDTLGVALERAALHELLERMGHGVEPGDSASLAVRVAAWRNDVMHPIDLIEDAAVAYGYDRIRQSLVPTFSVGAPRAIEEFSVVVRRVLTGLGLHQVMTLPLTSAPACFDRWRLAAGDTFADALRARAVLIDNPISSEQTMCRTSLLPGLLETLAINKQYDLPQMIFEVGDCSFVDPNAETGAREERFAAVALIGPHVGFADVRAVLDALAHELGTPLTVQTDAHPALLPGRAAAILLGSRRIGSLGELHPEVLENHGLRHSVAVLELSVAELLTG